MSLSEYSTLTPNEIVCLGIARACTSGLVLDGCINESEMRACARRLAMRGLGECFIHDKGPEVFRINSDGLSAHKHAVGK